MVDGVDVGSNEGFEAKFKDEKLNSKVESIMDFRNADMICIESCPVSATSGAPEDSIYRVFGVFGNTIVTSHAKSATISSYWSLWKDKSVLVMQKPYILNGV